MKFLFDNLTMRIGVIGINHKSADLRLRELLAKVSQRLFAPENSAHAYFSYVLLSTCNRTEVYFYSENPAVTHTYLINVLRNEINEEFEHRIYSYFGSDCFFHLARVTAGVDSALVGETEIQGQVKTAYESATSYTSLPRELHFLFQKCLKIGKNVRTNFSLKGGLPSLEESILNAARTLHQDLAHSKILFVGLSEINHKIFLNFKKRRFQNITFCNRTLAKVQSLAKNEAIHILPWEQLQRWTTFDLAIFGTKSPHFLIGKESFEKSDSPKLVIDLSVPRTVDPRLGRHRPITLLNVDQLNRAIDSKRKLKAAEIARIETQLISQAVEKQIAVFKLKELQRAGLYLSHVS